MTGRALAAPERRAHNSRDPAQDRTVLALLDRRSRRVAAQLLFEQAATEPLLQAAAAVGEGRSSRSSRRGRRRRSSRSCKTTTRGWSARCGSGPPRSAIMPPWLLGELVDVLGPGVLHEALVRARTRDKRPGAGAYYDAFAAEVAWASGEPAQAERFADRAIAAARPVGGAAQRAGARDRGRRRRATRSSGSARASAWPRRSSATLASSAGSSSRCRCRSARRARSARRSPTCSRARRASRRDPSGLALAIDADRASARVCLSDAHGQVIGCAEAQAKRDESEADVHGARRAPGARRALRAPRRSVADRHQLPRRPKPLRPQRAREYVLGGDGVHKFTWWPVKPSARPGKVNL